MAVCSVCASPHRADIEQWMREQVTYLAICGRLAERGVKLYPRSLSAHRKHVERPLILAKIRRAEGLVLETVTELDDRREAWKYLEALNSLHAIR